MSPAAAIEEAYATNLRGSVAIPIFAGLSSADLPQHNSFVVAACGECQHVGGQYYRGTLSITLRTHALDETVATHSASWALISAALDSAPSDHRIRGQFRSEVSQDRDEHYWITSENIVVGFVAP